MRVKVTASFVVAGMRKERVSGRTGMRKQSESDDAGGSGCRVDARGRTREQRIRQQGQRTGLNGLGAGEGGG